MQDETEILNNAIFDNIDHLLVVTDKNGTIKRFNRAAEKFLGYTSEELVDIQSPAVFHLGSEVVARAEIFSKELKCKIEPGFEVFVAKTNLGLPNEHEWTYVTKDGTNKPVLLSVTAVRDNKDDIIGYIGVAKDISKSKLIAEDLQISQTRLKEAQRIAKIGSWSLDLQTNTLLWSDEIYAIFEIDPLQFEPSYEGFLNSIHPDDVSMVNLAFTNSLEDKAPYNIEHRLLMNDGRIKYVVERGETIYSKTGESLLTQGTVQDITQLKLTQINLTHAKESAENSNKAKSRFLANMSHEIRTPLNGIMGFIELLQKYETDPKKSEYLNIIHTSSKSLQVVINDILDLSKIEDGNMQIEVIDFNLAQHLHDLIYFFTSIADAKQIALHFKYPEELGKYVHTDPLRLKQILSNLISNAIKFSAEGSNITLSLRRDGNKLRLCVSDEGIGISKEAQLRIFNPFEQAELSTTRSYGGTGLGLSISKKLIELLNGKIQVESELGKGTTFSFFIDAPEIEYIEDKKDEHEEYKLEGHILVAEDNKTNQLLISILLEDMNLTFTMVEDGKQAVDAFELYPDYDLILMDINMPVLDGVEATKHIRTSTHKNRNLPIIALTANAMKEDVEHYKEAGMNDHVAKPIDSDLLEKTLSNYLKRIH